jgi:hypothetical protein
MMNSKPRIMDDVLDRGEVLRLFKVIFDRCRHIEGKSIKLMPPNADSVHSKGYQIHISPNNDEALESCIERVAKEHELAVADEGDMLVIFKPLDSKPHIHTAGGYSSSSDSSGACSGCSC